MPPAEGDWVGWGPSRGSPRGVGTAGTAAAGIFRSPHRDLVPGRECLRCPLVTLWLLMGLFLVQDPKCFIAINYPNGEAMPVKPILQMGSRAQEEVNDPSGAGAGLE